MTRRLFVPPASLAAGALALGGEDHRYLARVLRVRAGDELVLFDGAGREARARIARVELALVHVVVEEAHRPADDERALRPITLLAAILKGDRTDLVVQKATELGVARIVPICGERSIVRLDEARARSRHARWEKVAREAARQCGRADSPVIDPAVTLAVATLAAAAPADALRLVLHERARSHPLRTALTPPPDAGVVFATGPEGGWSNAEVDAAVTAGFLAVGLGPRVLRAETAAIAGMAILAYALGALD